ncbi:MAG: hypothetical protein QOC73_630 [Actinomycetota bacterium]|nr:hypothetical protein [Actinomycetota bacterium]
MNDEDFAHQAFASAFAAGSSKEPMTLPDAEALAFRGRRTARNRRGIYAAGTTALVGVVTAGVAGGPSLLNLGAGSGSTGIAAAGGSSVSPALSKPPAESPNTVKPSGVPCANPPAIDWAAIVAAALPAGIQAVSSNGVNCLEFPEGSRSIRAGFKLSAPDSILQIEVESGGALAAKLGQTAKPLESKSAPPAASGSGSADLRSTSPSLDPSAIASLEALKSKMAADASTRASLDALKLSMAATDDAAARAAKESIAAAASASLASDGTKPDQKVTQPTCHQAAANISVCTSTVTKGGTVGIDVQLVRSGANPVVIDVVAAAGADGPSPAPGTKAPLTDVQVTAIAQAVAAHV